MRLLLAIALALPLMGSSCTERSCDHSEDCLVGEVCGRGRICVVRECGFTIDGSAVGDNCEPGYSCVEGLCQIQDSNWVCSERPDLCPDAGRPEAGAPIPPEDAGPAADAGDAGGAPAADAN